MGEDLGDSSDSALLGLASSWPVRLRDRGVVGRESWLREGTGRKGNLGKEGKGKAGSSAAAEVFMLWSLERSLDSSASELLESNTDILKHNVMNSERARQTDSGKFIFRIFSI